jgi:hypothetical protein
MTNKSLNKSYYERNKEKVIAKTKAYYYKNKAVISEKRKLYRAKNKDKIKEKKKADYQAFRIGLLDKLGGKCVQCGFSDWRGLQIDHVHDGGTKHRKQFKNANSISMIRYYRHIMENVLSGDYQLLCATCNLLKYLQKRKMAQ